MHPMGVWGIRGRAGHGQACAPWVYGGFAQLAENSARAPHGRMGDSCHALRAVCSHGVHPMGMWGIRMRDEYIRWEERASPGHVGD